jgi:glutathione S-transferase
MILYTINGSGSDAVQALAAYAGLEMDARPRNTFRAELETVNPAATVPTAVLAGQVVTETAAILRYLAHQVDVSLLGRSWQERLKVDELVSFLSTGLYAHYIQRFRPEKFVSDDKQFPDVKQKALVNLAQALDRLEQLIPVQGPFLVGKTPTIADFYALVVLRWQNNVQPLTDETPRLKAYWQHLQQQSFFTGQR